MISRLKTGLYWIFYFLVCCATILSAGVVLGSVAFVIVGQMLPKDYETLFLLKKGAWVGFRYAGIWAGGVSIVLCIMRFKKKREATTVCI